MMLDSGGTTLLGGMPGILPTGLLGGLASLLLAAPFLPAGKGGLILIAGGLAMLVVALLMLLAGAPGADMTTLHQHADQLPASVERAARQYKWPLFIQQQAARRGVGSPRLMAVSPTTCTISCDRCASCLAGRRTCRTERRVIQKAARRVAPRAKVEEALCGRGTTPCVFQVHMGGGGGT